MSLSLRYAARSHVGLIRDHNEDSGYAGPRLLVVADGMGGQAAGEVASSVVLRTIAQLDTPALPELPADPVRALADQVFAAHEQLRVIVAQNPQLEGMGTTLTAFLLAQRHLAFAHIGDSRAYRLRGGRLEQLTSDHTWVQRLVDEGRISEEEAGHHPQRSLLMRALDGRGQAEPDLSVTDAVPGDRLMLCSDGLSGVVSFETMEAALAEYSDPHQAAETLVQLALRGGGPDNITCIVADVLEDPFQDQGATQAETQYLALPTTVGAAADAGPGTLPPYGPAGGQPPQSGPPPGPQGHLSVPSDDIAPDTPSGRAARMRREPRDGREPRDQAETTAEMAAVESDGKPARRWVKPTAGLAVAVVLLGGAAAGGYSWSQKQYYVAVSDGQVAIYQGVDFSLGGVRLSHVVSTSPQVSVAGLPIPSQTRVNSAIAAASLSDARDIVATLGTLEAGCAELTAVPTPTLIPTSLPTPSLSPSATVGGTTAPAHPAGTKAPTSTATTPTPTDTTASPTPTPVATTTPATTAGTTGLNELAAQCPSSSGN
jgi:PPM family protein phosphatase